VAGECKQSLPDQRGDQDAAVARCSAQSFDEACRAYCLTLCDSEATFCRSSRCAPGYCQMTQNGAFHSNCVRACGSEVDPVRCMRDLCVAQTRASCANFAFPDADAGALVSACFDDDPLCTLTR
jgi:hypothetical protein